MHGSISSKFNNGKFFYHISTINNKIRYNSISCTHASKLYSPHFLFLSTLLVLPRSFRKVCRCRSSIAAFVISKLLGMYTRTAMCMIKRDSTSTSSDREGNIRWKETGITERVAWNHLHTAAQYCTKLRYATYNARIRQGVMIHRFANFCTTRIWLGVIISSCLFVSSKCLSRWLGDFRQSR